MSGCEFCISHDSENIMCKTVSISFNLNIKFHIMPCKIYKYTYNGDGGISYASNFHSLQSLGPPSLKRPRIIFNN